MKLATGFLFLLFGVGKNLPGELLYWQGIGLPDLVFLFLTLLTISDSKSSSSLKVVIQQTAPLVNAVLLMALLAAISQYVNIFSYGVKLRDFLEISKYLFCLSITLMTACWADQFGFWIAKSFSVGVLFSGFVAYLNPLNMDAGGIVQIYNPNVIGNLIAVSLVLGSIEAMHVACLSNFILMSAGTCLSAFTFSKGTWLMVLFSNIAWIIAIINLRYIQSGCREIGSIKNKLVKYYPIIIIILMISGVYFLLRFYGETIQLVFEAKQNNTQILSSAQEGGTVAARLGLILSALRIFSLNPIFGVGISNFEAANQAEAQFLGEFYYDDDNPNSAFFYVLSCMGIGAFICFVYIFKWSILAVRKTVLNCKMRVGSRTFLFLISITLFLGGNVQVEMLTSYYFWIVLGILNWTSNKNLLNR